MDFFESPPAESTPPLAERMRPRTIDEVAGQEHLIGENRFLRRLLNADKLPSLILWGPPGCGKTTLARTIANQTSHTFVAYSAVLGSITKVREIIEKARIRKRNQGTSTILFIDEIHRFNKAQQDAFLPSVEDGTITLIGATTENPSFEVIAPLLSRSRVLNLRPLEEEDIRHIIQRAMEDTERGLGELKLQLDDDALGHLIQGARGDARRALTVLEAAADLAVDNESNAIAANDVVEALQEKMLLYDRGGEEHYNVVSAFIKSMRGSDPDAALYWMLRMLDAGEEPHFILRRMIIFAAEDVGNADPWAIMVATSALEAFDMVGLPEGEIPMAQACTYLSTAPKSNASYMALKKARAVVKQHGALDVPLKLRNAPTKLMKNMGYGKEYNYPHNAEGGFVAEEYLPDTLRGSLFYHPKEVGYEKRIAERVAHWRGRRKDNNSET